MERGTSVCLSLQSLTLKDLSLAGRSHPITCWRDPGPFEFHDVGPSGQGLRSPMISLALIIPAPTARRKNTVRMEFYSWEINVCAFNDVMPYNLFNLVYSFTYALIYFFIY